MPHGIRKRVRPPTLTVSSGALSQELSRLTARERIFLVALCVGDIRLGVDPVLDETGSGVFCSNQAEPQK